MFWSTEGNNLETTMTKTGVSGTNLTAKVDYVIEADWDYAYLEASKDNGTTWTDRADQPVDANTNPNTPERRATASPATPRAAGST